MQGVTVTDIRFSCHGTAAADPGQHGAGQNRRADTERAGRIVSLHRPAAGPLGAEMYAAEPSETVAGGHRHASPGRTEQSSVPVNGPAVLHPSGAPAPSSHQTADHLIRNGQWRAPAPLLTPAYGAGGGVAFPPAAPTYTAPRPITAGDSTS